MGIFEKFKIGLNKSSKSFSEGFKNLALNKKVDTEILDQLENFLIELKKKAKLESNFEKLKINLNLNIDKLISGINLQRLQNNPINLNKKDIKTILLKSN